MFSPPQRILFLRPDTYGDLFLFEPVPRVVRHVWPGAEVAVLIRARYQDAVPLLETDGVRWLTTACDPYHEGPGGNPAALDALRDTVRAFAPDCVVAACVEQTWLEAAVAGFLPEARQLSLGPGLLDPVARTELATLVPMDWARVYPEKVPVGGESSEWDKNMRLADAVVGREVPRWWPVARVPPEAAARAAQVLAETGLSPGTFVVCAAAGLANVQIKSWPAEHYGDTLAWLEREHGARALLVGHETERAHLERVRRRAREGGADPALWTGRDGEMPLLAALLAAARFYFGNDTGALHLAAALGRPVCPVFGGGHWPRFRPVAARELTVVQPLPCFGCAWDCPFGDAPCVQTISPESVRHALGEFLVDPQEKRRVFEAGGLDGGVRALIEAAAPRLRFLRQDSADRLRQVQTLSAQANARERDLAAADARHRRQLEQMETLLQGSEADRDARLVQVDNLQALLRASEADRAARGRQVEELLPLLKGSEADRDARLVQVDNLQALLRASEADRAARGRQVEELLPLLQGSEADRAARGRQVEELLPLLQESEADRAARGELLAKAGEHLQSLGDSLRNRDEHIQALHTELGTRDQHLQALAAEQTIREERLRALAVDLAARDEQIQLLTAKLRPSPDSGARPPTPRGKRWPPLFSKPRPATLPTDEPL